MSAIPFNSIDDFLNHSGDSFSGGNKFLKDWKKAGQLDAWLHTKRSVMAVYQHKFPKLVTWEDKETKQKKSSFFSQDFVCWEDEGVLRQQRFREPDGTRKVPPKSCPICKMLEWLRTKVSSQEIALAEKIFVFQGASDSKFDTVRHAGGLCGLFNDKLSDEDVAKLSKRGIYMSEAWRESAIAKLSYVFTLVDNENVGNGVQISTETALLGEAVKKTIGKEMDRKGREDGNPSLHPYVIRFTYTDDKKVPFNKRYDACVLERPLTPAVEALIRGDAPDLSKFTAPFDARALRGIMEQYSVFKMPWDEFFDGIPAEAPATNGVKEAPPPPQSAKVVSPPKASAPAVEMLPCESCNTPMRIDETKCKKCGAEYEDDDGESEDVPF